MPYSLHLKNARPAYLIMAAVLCITSTSLLAQLTTGAIFGTVKDASGAFVANAKVTLRADTIGLTRTVTTSSVGEFSIPNLPPATYSLEIEAEGFKKVDAQNIVLSAGDRLSGGNFVLDVGTAATSVTVTEDAAQLQLQSNSGERSDLISNRQLNEVAINGRNVLDYMKLVPGVISSFNGQVSATGGLDQLNINGTRGNQHEYTIDGASNVDTGNNGGTHVTINPDAIDEVKVITANYQAEYGKAAAGQIAIVTKSGTNQWHGDVRFFHRNESLNANEWFNKQNQFKGGLPNTPPLYRYNYVGYQLGGPILKNKLFFFWSQEFYEQLVPISGTTQFYTPTAAERQGDFSASTDGNGLPVVIAGPGITNNKIDPSQLPSAQQAVFAQMQKILNLFPLPNVSGFGVNGQNYNFSEAFSGNAPRREDILRIDWVINDKNRLYGRWIYNSENDSSPFTSFPGPFGIFACSSPINFPGGCTQNHPGWNLAVNLVTTIKPNLLNEFSVGPSHTLSEADGTNGNISRGANGITLPLLFPVSPDQSIPDLSFSGLNNVNFQGPYLGGTPWKQANTTINVYDNVTWVHNTHTVKTGIFYQRNRKNQVAWGNVNGQFGFTTAGTSGGTCPTGVTCTLGDPIASALLGDFNNFDQSTARPLGQFRYNQLEFFGQDTWKLTPRLTLDYGMRFVWIPPQYDASNQIALFDPSAYNPANAVTIDPSTGNIITADGGDPLNGMKFTKNGGLPQGGWNSQGIMVEPRFGFAYDLYGDGSTVLGGGFGIMRDRSQGNLIFKTVFNNPALVQTPSVAANNIANLPGLSTTSAEVPTLSNIVGASRSGEVPTIYSFSMGIQRAIGKTITLDMAYVGTLSRHLVTSRDINAMPYGTLFSRAAQDPNCSLFGGTVPAVQPNLQPQYLAAGYDFNGWCALGAQAFTNAPLVPYKGYGQISYLEFNGNSNYNSLQISLQRRFTGNLTFGLVYTWSRAIGTAAADSDVQDPFNQALDYRALDWDRAHVFAANYVYYFPNAAKHYGWPKWLSYFTDNWQISGVTQFMTGTPIAFNSNFSFPPGSVTGSNQYGAIPFYYSLNPNTPSGNPALPAIGPPVRGSRDTLRTGGMQNWDISLLKNIPIRESMYFQLRLEAFNAFNHPNFN